MPLSSARRSSLVPQVIAQLKAQIESGEWAVGSRIPPEPELAAALGVGRNTLREAVLALVHAGLLERRQGSGTYVVGSRELAGAVARRLADAHVAEVVEVRRALEVEAARSAACADAPTMTWPPSTPPWPTGRPPGRPGTWPPSSRPTCGCTSSSCAAAHNRVLADLYDDFSAALRHSLVHQLGPTLTEERYADHARLVEAIRAGDADRAATEAAAFLEPPPTPR